VVRLSYFKSILIGVVAVISCSCENMNLSTKVLIFHLMLKGRSTFRFVVLLWFVNFSGLATYSFQKVTDVRKFWKTSAESTDYSVSIAWLFVLKYLKIMLIHNLCYNQMIFVHLRKAFKVIHRQFWLCYRYISCGNQSSKSSMNVSCDSAQGW